MDGSCRVTVVSEGTETELSVPTGTTLREALLAADCSPYGRLSEHANCGGRGLCATCGVRLAADMAADHWHDRLADRFGYPRLSCQVTVDRDMRVTLLDDKLVWGGREP